MAPSRHGDLVPHTLVPTRRKYEWTVQCNLATRRILEVWSGSTASCVFYLGIHCRGLRPHQCAHALHSLAEPCASRDPPLQSHHLLYAAMDAWHFALHGVHVRRQIRELSYLVCGGGGMADPGPTFRLKSIVTLVFSGWRIVLLHPCLYGFEKRKQTKRS